MLMVLVVTLALPHFMVSVLPYSLYSSGDHDNIILHGIRIRRRSLDDFLDIHGLPIFNLCLIMYWQLLCRWVLLTLVYSCVVFMESYIAHAPCKYDNLYLATP